MKHWLVVVFALALFGSVCAESPDQGPTRLELVKQLKEKLGGSYKVLDGKSDDDIEIHSVAAIFYMDPVAPSRMSYKESKPPEGRTRIINIHLMPDLDLPSYQKFRAMTEARSKAFQEWQKKLSDVWLTDQVLKPIGSPAEELLQRLHPATKEERQLVEEFGKFVQDSLKEEQTIPPLPSHQFKECLYFVYSISDRLNGKDKEMVQTAERVVDGVMVKLK